MKNGKKPNIIQILSNRYNDLNDTHKKIADFILQNLEMATFSSLFEISKEIGVSDTTLIRFAREVGFRGFQELRESLIDYIRKILYPSHKSSLQNEQDQHPFIEIVMKKDMEYIAKTMSKIDIMAFDSLIDFILSARRIYCMGWGISSFLAEYLVFNLRFIQYDAVAVTRERRPMIQQIMPIEEQDLIIAFDFIVYSTELLEAIEYVRQKNSAIKIVTVTNDPTAQIVQYSHLSFFCDMSGHQFKLYSITAPICLLNAILEQVMAKKPEQTTAALDEFQKVVQSSPIHYSQFDLQKFQWETAEKRKS